MLGCEHEDESGRDGETTMDQMTARERWQRVEQLRSRRRTVLRWRWVVVALGGVLAAVLVANGNFVIGGLLAALLVARVVMLTKMQRLWKEREASFSRRFGPGAGPDVGSAAGAGPIDVT